MWILVFFVLIALSQHTYANRTVTVRTNYGDVLGYETDLARIFYGIPFAHPPIGPLRWRKPVPIGKWAPLTINATEVPPACPQSSCGTQNILCPQVTSEDCLYLNIFAPLQHSSSLRPVMIFIHGGDFDSSSASIEVYRADRFVNTTNVICVFIQYRLGLLGFLATGPGRKDLNGNYAILDQRVAIAWIKSNIKAFRGDPDKITLFGQSAGAQSTALHYITKEMQPFFQAVIIESCPLTIPFRTYQEYSKITTILAGILNCSATDLACFRAASSEDIIAAQNSISSASIASGLLEIFEPWLPVIDNLIVHGQTIQLISKTSFPLKPLIIGTMTEEGLGYVYGALGQPVPPSSYSILISTAFGNKASKILKRFPAQGSGDQRPVVTQLITQWVFACPTRLFARQTASHIYVFGYPLNSHGLIDAGVCQNQACHGYELPFLFQAFWNIFNNTDRYVSHALATFWTNFAKSKHPNRPVQVPLRWPQLTSGTEKFMYFQDPIRIVNNYWKDDCDFWDTIGY